jgi:3-phenylpropionate/trans-cinnamate dioxygenase ferredoxin reductase component
MRAGVVILGGGLAGQRCAETLRRSGYLGPIVMVCGEPHLPYDRPPLSKELLLDAGAEQALSFRPPGWYQQKSLQLLLGIAASGLDTDAKCVQLSDGSCLRYEQLLIATGARARGMALLDGYENVTSLRTREDAQRLRAALVPSARLLVIGAGFIGQEAASAAFAAGARTTIVEVAEAPLIGVLGSELGAWFTDLHRSHGAELLLGEQVVAAHGERRVDSVTLSGGSSVACDHVLLGVGVEPSLDWLSTPGLERSGVRTDVDGRTDVPDVYAAGDAAATFDPMLERHVLGNHWESAGRQGARAAKAMLGLEPGPPAVSSFWSELYGTRIHYLGHASLADELSFDGDSSSREFTATFTRDEEPVAVVLAGRSQMLPQARSLLSIARSYA